MRQLDYNKVLRDFQYKPNFAYGAYERDGSRMDAGWWIRIVMMVENARAPWKQWELKPYPQDEHYGEMRFYDTLRMPPPVKGVGFSPSREMMEVVGNYPIPHIFEGEDDRFVEWMVSVIRKMEDHETFEWLRYKGELINDPHKE